MSVEAFEGGVFYTGVIDPAIAESCGRTVRAFRRYSRSNFFIPPINDVLGSQSRVLKAWLTDPKKEKEYPSLYDDFFDPSPEATAWGSVGVKKLVTLAQEVQTITQTVAKATFVQSYPPLSMLAKHEDRGIGSSIVGLRGAGEFYIYSAVDPEEIVRRITIKPGDVLHFFGNGLHSAANNDPCSYRETVNIIDAQ